MENEETDKETNRKNYLKDSIENINEYIDKREFRQAFALFIMVMERLNETERTEFIDYYSKNMVSLGFFKHTFPQYNY